MSERVWSRSLSLGLLIAAGCSSGADAPGGQPCLAGDLLTELPVDEGAIASTSVIGGFSPPAHTVPSDHAGIYLVGQGLALRAPGAMTAVGVRRTRYLTSPFRAGAEDHALDLQVCADVRVTLGHIVSLTPELAGLIQPGGCQTYSTANETVETCYTRVSHPLAAGTPVGTVGGTTAGAFDFGAYDRRHRNRFANPARFEGQMTEAVCPWDLFAAGPRALLLSKVGVGTQRRVGGPPCGTMEVDRPGTAEGIWIEQGRAAARWGGDESAFVTLTRDVLRPNEKLLFSIGLPALGAGSYFAGLATARPFDQVAPDGAVVCYEVQSGVFRPTGSPRLSFLLSLTADHLRLEKREDPQACDGAPGSHTFGPGAVTFVR